MLKRISNGFLAHAVLAACAIFTIGAMVALATSCSGAANPSSNAQNEGTREAVGTSSTLPKPLTLDELRTMSSVSVEVRDETPDGHAREVAGSFPNLVVTDEASALDVLLALRDVFEVTSYDYELLSQDTNRTELDMYRLRQLHDGVPVESGIFTISTDKDGVVRSIGGAYADVDGVDATPGISANDASSMASEASGGRAVEAELMIAFDGNDAPALTWRVRVAGRTQASDAWVYVDAHTGTVLRQEPLSIS